MAELPTAEERLRERLSEWRASDEAGSQERSRRIAARDFAVRTPQRSRRGWVRLAAAAGVAALAALLMLSPAGARVGELVTDAIGTDEAPPAAPSSLDALSDSGRVLVRSSSGLWLVDRDGERHKLGRYSDATWSPHGLFIAATSGSELTAIDAEGAERWSVHSTPRVRDPAWSASGFRIAYLSGPSLRVVAGDGTGDRLLAPRVTSAAPAWRPPRLDELESNSDGVGTHQLTYADREGRIHLLDTDSGKTLWRTSIGTEVDDATDIEGLEWSVDGDRLLITLHGGYVVLDRAGRLIVGVPSREVSSAALAPGGKRVALVEGRGRSRTILIQAARPGGQPTERLLTVPRPVDGIAWTPDGRRLAVEWAGGDSWVILRPGRKAKSIGDVGSQFDAAHGSFPTIVDWCCDAGR